MDVVRVTVMQTMTFLSIMCTITDTAVGPPKKMKTVLNDLLLCIFSIWIILLSEEINNPIVNPWYPINCFENVHIVICS